MSDRRRKLAFASVALLLLGIAVVLTLLGPRHDARRQQPAGASGIRTGLVSASKLHENGEPDETTPPARPTPSHSPSPAAGAQGEREAKRPPAVAPRQARAATTAARAFGVKDRYNPADAIPATANLLRHSGAPADYRRAIFAYNHAAWYVDDVLARAARYRGAADADPDAVQAALVADTSAVYACTDLADSVGPVDLNTAVRLTFPTAYRPLPAWVMAGGRPTEPVDARIYNDVLWVLRRYHLRISAAREAGHHTHGDGTAVDLVPAAGASQRDWDETAGHLARDLVWMQSCGGSGARPACRLKPAVQWIGYDGYPNHGSPRTCRGGCPAHFHVSWVSGCYGSSALAPPCAWVMAFPVPSDDHAGEGAETRHQPEAAEVATPRDDALRAATDDPLSRRR